MVRRSRPREMQAITALVSIILSFLVADLIAFPPARANMRSSDAGPSTTTSNVRALYADGASAYQSKYITASTTGQSYDLIQDACRMQQSGAYAEALSLFDRALAAYRKHCSAADSIQLAYGLYQASSCLHALQRDAEALPLLNESFSLYRRIAIRTPNPGLVYNLSNLASLLDEMGYPEAARSKHEASLALARELGGPVTYALDRALRNSETLGLLEKSIAYRLEMLNRHIPLSNDSSQESTHLLGVARCLKELGEPAKAIPYYKKALDIQTRFHEGRDDSLDAFLLIEFADCLSHDLGMFDAALGRYHNAVDMLRRLYPSKYSGSLARALGTFAYGLGLAGHDREAVAAYEEQLEILHKIHGGQDNGAVMQCLANMAVSLGFVHRNSDALTASRDALAMSQRMHGGNDHLDVVLALEMLAYVLQSQERWAEALSVLESGQEMRRRLRLPPSCTCNNNTVAYLHERLGDLDAAYAIYLKAAENVDALRREMRGMPELARARRLASQGADEPFDGLFRVNMKRGRPAEAVSALERGRARSLLDLLEGSRYDPLLSSELRAKTMGDTAIASDIATLRSNIAHAKGQLARLDYQLMRVADEAVRDSLRWEQERVDVSLTSHLRARAQLMAGAAPVAQPSTAEQLQGLLDAEERLLIYVLGDECQLVVIGPSGSAIDIYQLRWPNGIVVRADSLARDITTYVEVLSRQDVYSSGFSWSSRQESWRLGMRLWQALVPKDVWEIIKPLDHVYLVPQGPLYGLPFEALVVKGRDSQSPEQYWLDDGPAVAYEPSGSVLAWCKNRRLDQEHALAARPPLRAVLLGDPTFPQRSASEATTGTLLGASPADTLAPLHMTRHEILSICRSLAGCACDSARPKRDVLMLLGDTATAHNLYEWAPRARYVHIATHGLSDANDPQLFNRLALATPQRDEESPYLRLQDLLDGWRDRLSGCELVVLSACETQRGAPMGNEGVWALPVGFLYAGTPAVIATRWAVRDAETADFMEEFYRTLVDIGNARKLEALRTAQLSMKAKHADPYFWSAFIFIGLPR